MARKPGSANKASFGRTGQIKNNLIKFRVSGEYLDTINTLKEESSFWFRGKSDSQIFRLLILEGALKFCHGSRDDNKLRELLQNQIESI